MAARGPTIGALLGTLVGLVVLGRGVMWAAAPPFFGTSEDYAQFYQGRTWMLIATAVRILASGVLGWEGRWSSAALVAAPGVVCTAVVCISGPGTNAYGLVLFLPLAPIALVAALVAAIRGMASG